MVVNLKTTAMMKKSKCRFVFTENPVDENG